MNNFPKLKEMVMALEADFEKFYDKQNAAAGTRVRKGMQDLKKMAQDIRAEIQGMKNGASDGAAPAAAPAKKAPAAKAAPAKKAAKK